MQNYILQSGDESRFNEFLQEMAQRLPNTGEAALRIAQTMLEQGIERTMVLLVTGLTEEELAASYA